MIDKKQRAHAAHNAMKDETLQNALTSVKETIIGELLRAKTPEEREQKYQEWSGIERAIKRLSTWAYDVRNSKE